jgi:hypothetical protein
VQPNPELRGATQGIFYRWSSVQLEILGARKEERKWLKLTNDRAGELGLILTNHGDAIAGATQGAGIGAMRIRAATNHGAGAITPATTGAGETPRVGAARL